MSSRYIPPGPDGLLGAQKVAVAESLIEREVIGLDVRTRVKLIEKKAPDKIE